MNFSDSWVVRLGRGVDAWLIRRGFAAQTLRAVVLCELGAGVVTFLVASLLFALPATRFIGFWFFWFSVGAFVGTVNFIILVISGQRLIRVITATDEGLGGGTVLLAVMSIMLKLFVTALLFCALVLVFYAPLTALLAGITLPVMVVLLFGFLHAGRQ